MMPDVYRRREDGSFPLATELGSVRPSASGLAD
jgi:hypothetical protein